MDSYAEYLVKKAPTSQDQGRNALMVIAALVICAGTIFLVRFTGPLILVLTIVAIYGAYYLFTSQNVEYEYIVTNDELDIDKVIAKRKRSRLISVEIGKFTAFGKEEEAEPISDQATTVLCIGADAELGTYYADLETEEYGQTRILFTPNESVLTCVQEALPRILKYRKSNL